MKKNLTTFLQRLIVLISIGVPAFMLLEPHFEGRNAHATLFQIYFNDPFLAYVYVASVPFFMALYQANKVLGYIKQNQTVSPVTVKALRTIKQCAIALIAFVLPPLAYLVIVRPGDDIAGGVFMGNLVIFGSVVIALAAAMFEKKTKTAAVDLKTKKDLTANEIKLANRHVLSK